MAALAARQYGVLSRGQLRGLGVSDSAISRAMETGRLHPVFRGVLAVGHPGIPWQGRLLAATLACGEGGVISHGSAAALLGLRDRRPVVIDVIVPGQRGRKIDGIRRHNVRRPTGHEVTIEAGIPCTTPARTLVDLAGVLGERSLRNTVERAAVLGALDAEGIERALPDRRGSRLLGRILVEWRGIHEANDAGRSPLPRLRSELEARLLTLIATSGLPVPLCNQPIDTHGHRYEADLLWPDHRLVVEADGRRFHDNEVAFERDRFRDRALHAGGYRVVRVTATQIEREPGAVIAAIGRILGIR